MTTKFLIIQTSFIGDVILATAVVEKLASTFPDAQIDFLVRKGNESVLLDNPKINRTIVWEKRKDKILNLIRTIGLVRKGKYDYVINLHRFASSGIISFLSGSKFKVGFHNNPFSFCYTHKYRHSLEKATHEVERNHQLITFLTDENSAKPRLYPSVQDEEMLRSFKSEKYICIAPGSVWTTKRLPLSKWVELCNRTQCNIYILGAPNESALAQEIIDNSVHRNMVSLCNSLTLLQSAALMKDAAMNYVNDSAPLHLCSAINAPCIAFFCSTVPEFGFGPLSDRALVIQSELELPCKPCGVHGKDTCPEGHFKCGTTISIDNISFQ